MRPRLLGAAQRRRRRRATGGSPGSGRSPRRRRRRGPVRALPGVLLPGLVNTHCHTPMLLLRGMGGDLPLLRWLHEVMWPAEGRLTASDVRGGHDVGLRRAAAHAARPPASRCTSSPTPWSTRCSTVGSRVLLTPGVIAAPGWDRLGSWEAMRNGISRAHRPRRPAVRARASASSSATGRTRRTRCRPRRCESVARARPGAGRAAAPPPGRDDGGGRRAARRARLGARAARPSSACSAAGCWPRTACNLSDDDDRAAGGPTGRRGALPGLERQARGRASPG